MATTSEQVAVSAMVSYCQAYNWGRHSTQVQQRMSRQEKSSVTLVVPDACVVPSLHDWACTTQHKVQVFPGGTALPGTPRGITVFRCLRPNTTSQELFLLNCRGLLWCGSVAVTPKPGKSEADVGPDAFVSNRLYSWQQRPHHSYACRSYALAKPDGRITA